MESTTGPLFSVAGLALAGLVLAVVTACVSGSSSAGYGSGRTQSNPNSRKIEQVRITADRMVADAKAASAGRVDTYWQDANNYKDIRDKVCKLATQSGSKHASAARITSMIKSIENDNTRLRTVTTDAASRVERRSNVNNALIASECRTAELGIDTYFQCSSMEHARSWHGVIALELSDLGTINDAAAGWTEGSLECLKEANTKRLEKENLELSESIYLAWTGYKNRRIGSAQSLDDASLQFAHSK